MKNVPVGRWMSAPNVPEQQVMVVPLVTLSVELPPVVPSLIGIVWPAAVSEIIAVAVPLELVLNCETAVIVTVFPGKKEDGAV